MWGCQKGFTKLAEISNSLRTLSSLVVKMMGVHTLREMMRFIIICAILRSRDLTAAPSGARAIGPDTRHSNPNRGQELRARKALSPSRPAAPQCRRRERQCHPPKKRGQAAPLWAYTSSPTSSLDCSLSLSLCDGGSGHAASQRCSCTSTALTARNKMQGQTSLQCQMSCHLPPVSWQLAQLNGMEQLNAMELYTPTTPSRSDLNFLAAALAACNIPGVQ